MTQPTNDTSLSGGLAMIRNTGVELDAADKSLVEAMKGYIRAQALMPALLSGDPVVKLQAALELKRAFDRMYDAINAASGCAQKMRLEGNAAGSAEIEQLIAVAKPFFNIKRKTLAAYVDQMMAQVMNAEIGSQAFAEQDSDQVDASVNADKSADLEKRRRARLLRSAGADMTTEQKRAESLKLVQNLRAMAADHRRSNRPDLAASCERRAEEALSTISALDAIRAHLD